MTRLFLLLTSAILSMASLTAQTVVPIVDTHFKNNNPSENLPFSRFGLGTINQPYLASSAAMGGLTAALRDPFSLNPENPASFSSLRSTAFEVGLSLKSNTTTINNKEATGINGSLSYLALGFPTYSVVNEELDRKPKTIRWGMGVSIVPFSTVGYNNNSTDSLTHPSKDSVLVTQYNIGSGGNYKLQWSNGVQYKALSVGINLAYIFGEMSYDRQLIFSNYGTYSANVYNRGYTVNGLSYSLGAQYDLKISEAPLGDLKATRTHLVIGAYGNPSTNFKTSSENVFRLVGRSVDTIFAETGVEGTGILPGSFTAGVTFEDNGKDLRGGYKIGLQYSTTAWSQYRNTARDAGDLLSNTYNFAIGGEYQYAKDAFSLKKRYRLGINMGTDPRSIGGTQLSSYTLTAGVGLPIVTKSDGLTAIVNINIEYGKLSAQAANSESYWKLVLGFTLSDNKWFLKRKFY
jgi:hypothetical protein